MQSCWRWRRSSSFWRSATPPDDWRIVDNHQCRWPQCACHELRAAGIAVRGDRVGAAQRDVRAGAAVRDSRRRHAGGIPGCGTMPRSLILKETKAERVAAGADNRLSESGRCRPADHVRGGRTERRGSAGDRAGGRLDHCQPALADHRRNDCRQDGRCRAKTGGADIERDVARADQAGRAWRRRSAFCSRCAD